MDAGPDFKIGIRGLMVRISAFQAEGRGSIPRECIFLWAWT